MGDSTVSDHLLLSEEKATMLETWGKWEQISRVASEPTRRANMTLKPNQPNQTPDQTKPTKDLRPLILEEEEQENTKPNNMTTSYQVLQYVKRLRKLGKNIDQNLEVTQLGPKISDKTQIYIALHEQHFYVLYDNPKNQTTIISDGANASIDNLEHFKERFTNRKLQTIKYESQIGSDHCGSSAICIALKFLRIIQNKTTWPDSLNTSKGLRNYLIKTLHRGKTEKLKNYSNIRDNTKSTRCENCNKQFRNRIQLSITREHVNK